MARSVNSLNRLYRNAAAASDSRDAWVYRVYSSPEGAALSKAVERTLRSDDWTVEQLQDLRLLLLVTRASARSLVAEEPMAEFWDQHASRLESELEDCAIYLSSAMRDGVQEVIRLVQSDGECVTAKHTREVTSVLESVGGSVLIFPPTPRLGHVYRSWVERKHSDSEVNVITNRGVIRALLDNEFDCVLFPAPPSLYANQRGHDTYLRSLLFTGLAPRAHFIAPDWSHYQEDASFAANLFRGLEVQSPKLQIIKESASVLSLSAFNLAIELDMQEGQLKASDFEELQSGGSEPCRFISLTNGLSYPVEVDASRVSVLSPYLRTGEWQEASKHPFEELEIGDIVIACVDSSERQSLRKRAAILMGDLFPEFSESQANWKSLLIAAAEERGLSSLEVALKQIGVKHFDRAQYWWLEDAIQPGRARDFEALLKFLGLDGEQVAKTMYLATKFDGCLITAGRSAGRAVIEMLDEEDFKRLESSLPVEVTLGGFGDAVYLLAPVVEVSNEVTMCRPSQVRRVVAAPSRKSKP